MRLRDLVVALAAGAVASALTWTPAGQALQGPSIDVLFWLRYQAFGPLHAASESPTVVVAIDEETYRTPPFADIPRQLWTPQIAKVMSSVLDGGAQSFGFDLIMPTSAEQFLRGYDREFMIALQQGARGGRILLSKVQHQQLPIAPYRGHSFAVGHDRNIRSVNLVNDPDDVIRRAPLTFSAEDRQAGVRRESSFALELAARALGVPIDWSVGDTVRLGDWTIPAHDDAILVNFDGGGADIPIYPLSDLLACAVAGNADYFRQHFAGKVVLLGLIDDVEDRKTTSRRFINGRDLAGRQPRCATEPLAALDSPRVRDTIPGVFVHATAINNLMRREPLRELSGGTAFAIVGGLGVTAAGLTAVAPLAAAGIAVAAGMAAYVALATVLFKAGLVLPLINPMVSVALAFVLILVYRIAIADKDKRRLRQMFTRYLSAELVDQLVASDRMPKLGGERREMSFLFTDVAGFTGMAERMDPTVLAPILNNYLDGACAVIKQHGGMVNEFIGDAILAFFGAPQDQPDHAARAVACARALDIFAEGFRLQQGAEGIPFGRTRIGVHTGAVFVGNVGSDSVKMKYSALGDVVNTASRLEGLNKHFNTRVIVSGNTLARCEETRVRPLGRVILKGRREPIDVYELVEEALWDSPVTARYREAYGLLDAEDPQAEAAFGALAAELPQDGCVALHLERLRAGERGSLVVMTEK